MMSHLLMILGGVVVLVGGGELLVRGAAALARALGISAMVVALTVVALGTSAPELVVCAMAALRSNVGICGGNVVGSNILNILLVAGATAAIYPLQSTATFVRREVPIMIGISCLFFVLVWDGELSRIDAGLLLIVLAAYMAFAVQIARREKAQIAESFAEDRLIPRGGSALINLILLGVGLVLLSGGSELFLRGAIGVARGVGVSDEMIGLTLVAFGTSIPELAASLIAAYRKHPDICLGNLVGSNIYNIAAIAGISGVIRPLPFNDEMLHVHLPVMVFAAFLLWPMVAQGLKVSRREGAVLLASYSLYLGWTIYHRA
ncbi:MAG: calcium/sodium antiporter [Phycisphaerae bacterium]